MLSGSEQRFSTTTRSAPSSAAVIARVDRGRAGPAAGGIERESREDDVVGLATVFDRAGDPPHVEAELAERPRPLLGFDRHAVGSAETERHDDSLRRHDLDFRCSGSPDQVWLM